MATGSLNYTPSKTVRAFMLSEHTMRAIMGPVGSGKTTGCIVELLRQAIQMTPGKDGVRRSRMLIVRNTKQQLKDTTLASVTELLPVEIWKWRESDMKLVVKFNDVHSEWLFRSLDTPEDVQRVLSLQVSWTWVEEAREVPVNLLADLEGRTGRYPSQSKSVDFPEGFRYRSGIIYSTNPPEVDSSHYNLLEHLPQVEDEPNSVMDCDVFKQPSGLSPEAENIENLRPGYYEGLAKGKPQSWIDVYVRGLYAPSQYGKPVYEKSFKYDRHNSTSPLKIDPHLPVIVGLDTARTPGAVFMQYGLDGRLRKLREAVGFDMGAKTFIKMKMKPIVRAFFPTNPLVIVYDPSSTRKDNTSDSSWVTVLKDEFPRDDGHHIRPASTNDLTERINSLDAALRDWPDGDPGVEYDPSCKMLIEGLRSKYRYPKKKGSADFHPTPDKNNWSHVVEADQYGTMFIKSKFYRAEDYARSTYNPLTGRVSHGRPVNYHVPV